MYYILQGMKSVQAGMLWWRALDLTRLSWSNTIPVMLILNSTVVLASLGTLLMIKLGLGTTTTGGGHMDSLPPVDSISPQDSASQAGPSSFPTGGPACFPVGPWLSFPVHAFGDYFFPGMSDSLAYSSSTSINSVKVSG